MSTNRVPSVVTGQREHFVILLLLGLFPFALLYIQKHDFTYLREYSFTSLLMTNLKKIVLGGYLEYILLYSL